jgi:hypothetical protein
MATDRGSKLEVVAPPLDLEEMSAKLDGALDDLKKHYKADGPDQKMRFLVRDMIHPVLELMRKEYMEGLAYLEDELEDVASGDASEQFTDQTRRTVAALGQVLDATWLAVGWMGEKGYTDKAPDELKQMLEAASALVRELLERAEAEDEDDDGDDDDDPDDGEDGEPDADDTAEGGAA